MIRSIRWREKETARQAFHNISFLLPVTSINFWIKVSSRPLLTANVEVIFRHGEICSRSELVFHHRNEDFVMRNQNKLEIVLLRPISNDVCHCNGKPAFIVFVQVDCWLVKDQTTCEFRMLRIWQDCETNIFWFQLRMCMLHFATLAMHAYYILFLPHETPNVCNKKHQKGMSHFRAPFAI